jgi:ergothioneine biosynthesis protein EgtB
VNVRRLTKEQLAVALDEARAATFAVALDLTDEQWRVPYHAAIQPTAWDLGHVAWFAEFWCLRAPHRLGVDGHVRADRPAQFVGSDEQYDSARVAHRDRWQMPLFRRGELLPRMQDQLAACQRAIAAGGDGDDDLYHGRFAVYHELMHVEALVWTRGILGYPAPAGMALPTVPEHPEVAVPGGEYDIGCRTDGGGFAFDNELPGRTASVRPFAIDVVPITNAQFRAFVEVDGYRRPEFWPGAAGSWLAAQQRDTPERWRRSADGFEQRWFDTWRPLPPHEPVIHVNAYEAEAYCRFVNRRLPTAAEWEIAAPHMLWGKMVWEWTADPFTPYPGFRPGPYHTYSAPWFHHQRELRGGAFATHRLMHDARYRNFFLPERTDVFAGFRTAAR